MCMYIYIYTYEQRPKRLIQKPLLERIYVEKCFGNHGKRYSELPKAITWFHDESLSFLHFRSYLGLRWGDELFWSAMQLASSMWHVEEKTRCGLHNTGKSLEHTGSFTAWQRLEQQGMSSRRRPLKCQGNTPQAVHPSPGTNVSSSTQIDGIAR